MTTVCKLNSFIHSKRIYLILKTPILQSTSLFYTKLSQLITNSGIKPATAWQDNQNVNMIISSCATAESGFLFIKSDTSQNKEIRDPDSRPIHICSETSPLLTQLIPFYLNPIAILRSNSIEITKNFYAQYATCHKEKHGSGPSHCWIDWNGPLTEIYPLRKIYSGSVELLFQISDFASASKNLSDYSFTRLPSDESQILIHDPDGRLIRIVSTVIN